MVQIYWCKDNELFFTRMESGARTHRSFKKRLAILIDSEIITKNSSDIRRILYFCMKSGYESGFDIEALIYLPSYQTSTICISEGQGVTTLVYLVIMYPYVMYDAIRRDTSLVACFSEKAV